ncbi:MAG: AAA family ATPase, partial [Ruminococcus flavefaciens]|nr:AAA family ATPase [Ruminococcus flavefaciens]
MRYYGFALNTNAEKITENAKIRLKEYDYQSPIAAMNNYMYRNMKNGICYFAYREEENAALAAFSYDEKKDTLHNAYEHILELLNNIFGIKKVKAEPCEVTMYQFYEYLFEAKRRDYFCSWMKIVEAANIRICDYYKNEPLSFHYELREKIISENHKKENPMYDKSMLNELSNIASHKNVSDFKGNMVHYIVSGRSMEAADDMVEILMQRLTEANRFSGRRMEIIREIEPDLYKIDNHLEEFIENNYGGVIAIDLSKKFGYDAVDYGMTCKYIERLVKKYKNDCLFVFTYNIEKPGFAYQFLSLVQKYVITVQLREGKGDRKAAVSYLKELIKASEYAKYAGQANEFMKQFPGREFTQTDVLMAFEQFEPWCLNRNVMQAYDSLPDTFMLDRDEDTDSSYHKLEQMIGLTSVKEQIDHIIAADIVEKERKKRRGSDYKSGTMHMIFGGNPGTAKTTVAKLFAGIAKEKGILKSGAFIERGGMDLDGLGCAVTIREAFMAAKGGVLFIDEAYSLKSDTAVTVLIQEMENNRDNVIVILAGYHERMQEFMEINEGLKSRIPYWVDFPDYNVDELTGIFQMMIKERGFTITEDAIKEARNIFEKVRFMDNFGNGRYVRNLIERAAQNQSVRLLAARENAEKIRKKELFMLTGDDISVLEEGLKSERKSGDARKELEEMIGLSSVKTVIHKAVAGFKLKRICMDKGIRKENPSLHMVFTGNPGTAKTTVARLF